MSNMRKAILPRRARRRRAHPKPTRKMTRKTIRKMARIRRTR